MKLNPSVKIREFSFEKDLQVVRDLWENAGPGIQLRRSDEPEEIRKKLGRDPDLFLVAEISDNVIGTVIGGFDGRRGIIYHLAVREDARQMGIAALLMEQVEKRLQEKGCIRMYLLVTRDNKKAIQFYEKRGWSHMEHVLVYGKDIE